MAKRNDWIGWKKFHEQLDVAIAIWITDGGTNLPTRLPSKTSLMTFMEFSHEQTKKVEKNNRGKE
jgi:hypothetical protein